VFGFGIPELIIILIIVLFVFGADRLPEIGGALGRSVRNFKSAAEGRDDLEGETGKEEHDGKR
jgi:sec-independent protein translocase protein TatA